MAICPCEVIEPCGYACSCANPVMSGGCQRCASYGNADQRERAAKRIAGILDAAREARVRGEQLPPFVADPLDPAERIPLSPVEQARAEVAIDSYRKRTER